MRGQAGCATLGQVLALTLAAMAVFVACGPTYGESPPSDPPVEAGPNNPTTDSGGTTPVNDGGGLTPATDASSTTEAGQPCPPCPDGQACIGSGCVGPRITSNSCNAATTISVATNIKLTLFLCPGGQTITFPAACQCGTTVHAVAVDLQTGKWRATASGVNPFLATGDCTTITSVSSDLAATTTDYGTTPALLLVGTTDTLTSCKTITLDLASQ
jgi:hypothetical protein